MLFRALFPPAFLALALAGRALAGPDTVKIAQGELHGAVVGLVASFKGIPFAAPPVGELRWRPPAPPQPWSGVRQATVYGPGPISFNGNPPTANQSEDCLTLNLWKPADATPGARLPVMVWIYGGAFRAGSGANPNFDGTEFAKRGVILVTFNYRVGRLGYFAHPALTAEQPDGPLGNYGVMDALAALQWVQGNIAAFGGDADNVTFFGQSAGAETLNILMATPAAKGLFAKAIAHSGFGRLKAIPVREVGEGYGVAYANALGVTGTSPEAIKRLRAFTPAQLVAASVEGSSGTARPMRPMIDGVLVIETPEQAFAAGRELRVPYIAGNNNYEASLNPAIAQAPENTLSRAGRFRDQLVALYGGDPGRAAYDFTTETSHTEPTRFLARQHAKNGQKAWVYYGSYVPAADRGSVHGMPHGGEIRYVFGTLPNRTAQQKGKTVSAATPEDWAMSKSYANYWVAFAKNSDPDKAGGSPWPAFDLETEPVLEFGNDGVHVRTEFRKASLDLIEQLASADSNGR